MKRFPINQTQKHRAFSLLATLAVAASLTACEGGGGSSDPQSLDPLSGARPNAAGPISTSGARQPDGQSANAGNPDEIRLALKIVAYQNGNGSVLNAQEAGAVVARINEIYGQCNMRFTLEEYVPVDPATANLEFGMSSMNSLDAIRGQFQSNRALTVTYTGNWDHGSVGAANAWTTMPGVQPSGAVLEAAVAKNAEIAAHELGHYLNLDHVNDTSNLLNPIIYKTSTYLSTSQCEEMRQTARGIWAPMLR